MSSSVPLSLIKALLNREFYDKYKHKISKDFFSSDNNARSIFNTIEKAYETLNDNITVDGLRELHNSYNPTITTAAHKVLDGFFGALAGLDLSSETLEIILKQAVEQELWTELANISFNGGDGLAVDISRAQEIIDIIREGVSLNPNIKEVTEDLDELLKESDGKFKWKFVLKTLRRKIEGIGPNTFTLIPARTNVGKCLGKDTPILMYDGTIKMVQDICVNDLLMGPDSLPRNVLSTCTGIENMYKVTYPWGESYVVNESHILSLKWGRQGKIKQYSETFNISLRDFLSFSPYEKKMFKGYKVGIDFNSVAPLSIPPYLLGAWLGDGHSDGPYFTNTDIEILNYLKQYAKSLGLTFKQSSSDKITYGLIGKSGHKNAFTEKLRQHNLLKNKHIPFVFKTASREDRLSILAGLLDTDGYFKNGMFFISQKNKKLSEDILFLARSLGLHATIKTQWKSATNGTMGNIGEYHSVTISGNIHDIPTLLTRKIAKKTNSKRKNLHFGIKVEKLSPGDYYGFVIDSDHLFVLGDFTVTHNTGLVTSFIFQPVLPNNDVGGFVHQGAKVLYIGNEESVSRTKVRALSCLSGYSEAILKTDSEKWTEAKLLYDKVRSNIKFIDAVGYSIEELSNYLKENKGFDILIVDILDKLSISGKTDNEAERLYKLYTTYRELGKRFDLAVIGTCQASTDAENREVFGTDSLANSKTGKGGELDLCLCLGRKLGENGEDNSYRTINIAKNKLNSMDGTVNFFMDKDTCRITA